MFDDAMRPHLLGETQMDTDGHRWTQSPAPKSTSSKIYGWAGAAGLRGSVSIGGHRWPSVSQATARIAAMTRSAMAMAEKRSAASWAMSRAP